MSTLQPEGEQLRRAVKWIASQRLEDETRSLSLLIQQASFSFNLTPKEEIYLLNFYRRQTTAGDGEIDSETT